MRTLLRHCCQNGNNVETTFDFVAFDNVASTLLLVWTGFKRKNWVAAGRLLDRGVDYKI